MRRGLLSLGLILICAGPALAVENCVAAQERPLQLMSAELKREFKALKKQKPPVYYMVYGYLEGTGFALRVADGGVLDRAIYPVDDFDVQIRVGSPALDNTRKLKNGSNDYSSVSGIVPVIEGDGKAFTTAIWRLTQRAVKRVQQDYGRVQADVQTASRRMDDSPDFVLPPQASFCRTQQAPSVDLDQVERLLVKVSRLVQESPVVLNADFDFTGSFGHRYFADSQGTRLKTPWIRFRLLYSLMGKTADGLEISRTNTYDMLDGKDLPSEEQLTADIRQSLTELELLSRAPLADPLTVPTILKNRAMGVFVHEVLGHRMEGHRQKEDSFGRTFTSKIGQQVTAPFISIVDDATLPSFKGIPLRGFYEYDDEGVKVRPVTLVENGVLKEFLMSSSPIKGFPASNGHGRREIAQRAVARMGNTRVMASETVPYETLEKMLVEEINRQGKPYGLIVEDLSGGFTMTDTGLPQVFKLEPKLVYRVYPDGKKEIIRGADLVGTPLVSFAQILAASDDYAVFNGSCGAESGWVPVSAIAPSVLFKTLEFEHTAKSAVKPPVLPPPAATGKGDKK